MVVANVVARSAGFALNLLINSCVISEPCAHADPKIKIPRLSSSEFGRLIIVKCL